jgi:hypothetical protein
VPGNLSAESGSDVELVLGKQLIFYSLITGVAVVGIAYVIYGQHGLYSAAYGATLVVINFLIATRLLMTGARISPVALMASAVGALFVDLALLTVGTLPVVKADWMNIEVYGGALIITHLVAVGLMARKVTGKLAYSGLKPSKRRA